MMQNGKLVWSKRRNNDGEWVAASEVDSRCWYTITPDGDNGWVPEHNERIGRIRNHRVECTTLSEVPPHYLRDAKRLCDIDHHQAIRNRGDADLKAYIERYPL